jgi:hypothetical protein
MVVLTSKFNYLNSSNNYDILVPQAHWRKQMQLKMKELELEFACEKEPLFEKWLTSNEITTH